MAQNDLAKQISEILDMSINQAQKHVDQMDAEQLINAESAVDAEDVESLQLVIDELDAAEDEKPDMTLTEIRKEINRLGKENLKQNETHDDVWPLIAKLSKQDWRMIWPAIDEQVLISLLSEALEEDQDSVSAQDADTIHAHAQDQLQEQMIYEGQVVQVVIPHGPHHTVGIRTQQGITMVKRSQLTQLHEHVLGMTAMPTLARMQELAGLQPEPMQSENRIHIPGVGTVSSEHMPRKIRLIWRELQDKIQELNTLIQAEPMDYTHMDLVCKHVQYLMNTLCHNVDSAHKHKP